MVCVQSKLSTFDEIPEVSDALEGAQQLSVIGRPHSFVRLQLGTVKSQRFPS